MLCGQAIAASAMYVGDVRAALPVCIPEAITAFLRRKLSYDCYLCSAPVGANPGDKLTWRRWTLSK
jgi:hypothetical protein